MSSLDPWVVDAAAALGIPATDLPADLRSALLELSEQLTEAVGPSAGPMTGLVLGLAIGRGVAPHGALGTLRDLATARGAQDEQPQHDGSPPGADTTVPVAHDARQAPASET